MGVKEFFGSLFHSRHPSPEAHSAANSFNLVGTKNPIATSVPKDPLSQTAKEVGTALSNLDDAGACQASLADINKDDDIIIAVMGATGVGKTSFITAIAGNIVQQGIGHDLAAGTTEVTCFKIPIPNTNSHLVLVDTPGFDDPERTNAQILTIIADWLKTSYKEQKKLNGIVYLHRITDVRFDAGAATTLTLFQHLCGGEVFDKVCLTTTKWNDVPPAKMSEYEEKEKGLKKNHWGVLIAKNSITSRFDSSTDDTAKETAIGTLRAIVQHANSKFIMKIQRELVDKGKKIHKTTAGKYAFTFEEKIAAQLFQLNGILVTNT